MRVRLRALPAAAALSAAVLTCATAAASGPRSTSLDSETSPTASAQQRRTPALDHVFVIMLENHSKSSVIGNANAPFLTLGAQVLDGRELLWGHPPVDAELHRRDRG